MCMHVSIPQFLLVLYRVTDLIFVILITSNISITSIHIPWKQILAFNFFGQNSNIKPLKKKNWSEETKHIIYEYGVEGTTISSLGEGVPYAWLPSIFICCTFNLSHHPNYKFIKHRFSSIHIQQQNQKTRTVNRIILVKRKKLQEHI